MRYLVLFLVLASTIIRSASAQSVHFELGGPGLASINVDSRFGPGNGGIGGRVGIGGFSINGSGVLFIPLGINYLLGKDNRNFFELGGGVTPVMGTGELSTDEFSSTFGHLLIGYRKSPPNGGFVFRAFISPVFGKGFFWPYYGGVSFGYKFGKR
ncbi:MAG: hypothetical protein RJA57_607 [Bacteroidota bacterium]|jgi:hypothetical protein